jgi:hypothetical protein
MAQTAAEQEGKFNRWNDEGFKQEYFNRFVVGADELVQTVEEEPEPDVQVFDEEDLKDDGTPTVVDPPATGEKYVSKFEKAAAAAKNK